jgi:hypothetical protein
MKAEKHTAKLIRWGTTILAMDPPPQEIRYPGGYRCTVQNQEVSIFSPHTYILSIFPKENRIAFHERNWIVVDLFASMIRN